MPDWMTVDYFLRYLRPFYPAWDDELAAQLVRQFKLPGDRKLKHEFIASHVAYLENGRIRFSEELTSLSDRFREIEITFDATPAQPPDWPSSYREPLRQRADRSGDSPAFSRHRRHLRHAHVSTIHFCRGGEIGRQVLHLNTQSRAGWFVNCVAPFQTPFTWSTPQATLRLNVPLGFALAG